MFKNLFMMVDNQQPLFVSFNIINKEIWIVIQKEYQ